MSPFVSLLYSIIELYNMVLIGWVILSLLIHFKVVNRGHPIVYKVDYALNRLVEPALRPIRKYMPDLGGVDVSPIILILLLQFAQNALVYYF